MKFIKILTILSLLLTACTAANYANAFEKVGILEDGVYRFSQNGIGVKKDLLVKVISLQNADSSKKIISMLNIPKKSKITNFKTSDTGVIFWPFYEFEGKFITTIIVENIKKEDSDHIDVKYVLNFKEAKLVKSFQNRP